MILASILTSFWMFFHHFSILFRHRFLHAFSDNIFSIFGRKWSSTRTKRHPKVKDALDFLAPQKHSENASVTQARFFIDFGHRFDDILKVLAPKIDHLASQGHPKTIQKRIPDSTSIFHWFFIDFGCHLNDVLMILACFWPSFFRLCCQYLPISSLWSICFHRPVSKGCGGDAPRLQSAAPQGARRVRLRFKGPPATAPAWAAAPGQSFSKSLERSA